MKKKFIYLASVALTAGLAACSSEDLLDEASGLKLNKGELAATIETTTSTRVNVKDYQITWDRVNGESIGVYGTYSNNKQQNYYQYNLKDKTSNNEAASFTPDATIQLPSDFTPTYAFYPYSTVPSKSVASGTLILNLKAKYDFVKDAIDLPMVGKVEDSKIAFQPVASLLKVTVVNMPSDKTYAKLTAGGSKPLAGNGTVNLNEDPYKLVLSGSSDVIEIDAPQSSTFTAGEDYDFYFVIPAGVYTDGLTFELGASGDNGDANATYSSPLVCGVNELYATVLRYEDAKTIQGGNIAELNEKLANGENGLTYDLSGTNQKGTIYIPNGEEEITLTLKLGAATSNAIKVAAAKSAETKAATTTPKVTLKIAKDSSTDATLDIDLPDSPVTIESADAFDSTSKETKITLATVTANTSEDILKVGANVTVTSLTLKGATNVYVKKDGVVTNVVADQEEAGLFGFKEDGATLASATTDKKTVTIGDQTDYELYYPSGVEPVQLAAPKNMAKPITISKGKEVTIDLNGFALGTTVAKEILNVSGILNITDTSAEGTGSITSAQTANDAVIINAGGVVNLQKGTIAKTGGKSPVQVNGTFNMYGGALSATSSATVAIDVKDGGVANVEIGGTATRGTDATLETPEKITYDVTGNVAVAAGGTFTLQAGNVDGTVSATGAASKTTTVAISGGKLIPTGDSAKALAITVSDGDVTVNISGAAEVSASDDVISLTGVNGGATKATLNISGTAKVSATETGKSAIVDATGPATINIKGGTVSSAKDAAISATEGSEITVTGGTIEGASSAVSLTSGKLTVPATATSDIELKGEKVISAVPTDAKGVILTLASDKAVYTGVAATAGNKVYTVYNTSGTSTAANAAVMTISAGEFHGDIISDAAEDFITGGNFYDAKNLYSERDTYVVFGKTLYWYATSEDEGYLYVGALASAK